MVICERPCFQEDHCISLYFQRVCITLDASFTVLTCEQSKHVHHGRSFPPRGNCLVGVEQGERNCDHAERNCNDVKSKSRVDPAERNG